MSDVNLRTTLTIGVTALLLSIPAATNWASAAPTPDTRHPTPDFAIDVMPILAKAGCNATTCHGSPVGKGGFKLSLFGYEPALDHTAIAKDADGKRVNLQDPAQSLILLKPTASVSHGGAQRFTVNSPFYKTILAWVKAGAPGLDPAAPRVTGVAVSPGSPWMPKAGLKQPLKVTASLSDGTTRDVTEQALFSSSDDAIAVVDERGVVTAKRPGETAVMVRYLGQVGVSRVAVLPPWKLDKAPKLTQKNYIDRHVQAKLKKLRVLPSSLCTDAEFLRRATLDTCGIIPTPEEVRAFVADQSPGKRARIIDQLLERPEFVDLWTLKWNDTLRNNPRLTRQGLLAYSNWIREQIAKNRPYDEFVRDLLTASGKNADLNVGPENLPPQQRNRPGVDRLLEQINSAPFNPAANYYVVTRDPLEMTSATTQVFLGVRLECARCHNHPFERWTQNDYYGLAAFFSGVTSRGNNQTPRLVTVGGRGRGVRHPTTNEIVEPRLLDGATVTVPSGGPGSQGTQPRHRSEGLGGPAPGRAGGEVKLELGEDRRVALATWLTSAQNPFFAKAIVNRIWAHYLGRGIVEPVDDFRATNPPSNPELLDALAKDLVERKFDLKAIHRAILNSRTYQQSSRPNPQNRHDTRNFARFYPKRLMAEQVYDSISQATGVFPTLNGGGGRRPGAIGFTPIPGRDLAEQEPVTRAMQLPALPPGPRGPGGDLRAFLDTFGKPRREVVCECERSNEGNMGQALALINGNAVNAKIAAPEGRVQKLVRENTPDGALVEELYLAALGRRPIGQELAEAGTLIREAKSRREGAEDLMWSLLNSREFLFIH